jgi:F0F1-type ATP synthase membrane subunit b/b'
MSLLTAEILSTVLNFSVVVFILWYAGRKPIAEFFAGRAHTIGTSVNEARALSSEAKQVLNQWEAKANDAEGEIERQREDAKSTLAKYCEATLTRVNAESRRISEESAAVTAAEMLRAKRALRRLLALETVEQARE